MTKAINVFKSIYVDNVQIFGVMFVVLAFLLYVDTDSKVYADLLHTMPSSGPLVVLEKIPAIFFSIGLVVLALSFLGCYGACTESVCFLWLVSLRATPDAEIHLINECHEFLLWLCIFKFTKFINQYDC